jgi:hypothetical protein
MARKRDAIPVVLTQEQRRKLERLWFHYGNYGPQTTPGNHIFIQGLLEHGKDVRPLRLKGYKPTAECEAAVDAVLAKQEKTRTCGDAA